MAPIIERNIATKPHPGAEPEDPAPASDSATVQAIKGKGLVATISPHFAVAVIVGLITAYVSRKPDPVSENVGADARRCNESVTQLRADFNQFRAETQLHNQSVERDINQLLIRVGSSDFRLPRIEPSPIASGVARELSR